MNKKAKQTMMVGSILLLVVCIILASGSASAWFWDNNKKDYDSKTKTVTVKDKDNKMVAKVKLLTPQHNYVMRGTDVLVAKFQLSHFEKSYKKAFKKMELFDNDNFQKSFDRDITFKYLDHYESMGYACEVKCDMIDIGNLNGTLQQYCEEVCDYSKNVTLQNTKWREFKTLEDITQEDGDVTIGLFTDVLPNDNVEFIPTWFDVRMPEFAAWEDSFNMGLVMYYSFDDTLDSSSNIVDVTYQGFNLTTVGGTPIRNETGKVGGALHCDASNDYLYDSLDLGTRFDTDSMTWCGWINGITGGIGDKYFAYMDSGNGILYYNNGEDWQFNIGTDYGYTRQTRSLNVWNFVCVRYNGATMMISINGTNQTMTAQGDNSYDISGLGGVGNWWISHDSTSSYSSFDEVGLWNRSLTDAEITAMYNTGTGLTYVASAPNPAPFLNISSPLNHSIEMNSNVTFNYYVHDNGAIAKTELYQLFRNDVDLTKTFGTALPVDRSDMQCDVLGDAIYVYGGITPGPVYSKELLKYNITTDTWNQTLPDGYVAVEDHQVVACANKIFILGGKTASASGWRGDVQIFDTTTTSWSHGLNMEENRSDFMAECYDSKVYVLGGRINMTGATKNVSEYTISSNTWDNTLTDLDVDYHSTAGSVIIGDTIYMGEMQINQNTEWRNNITTYNVVTDTHAWTNMNGSVYQTRHVGTMGISDIFPDIIFMISNHLPVNITYCNITSEVCGLASADDSTKIDDTASTFIDGRIYVIGGGEGAPALTDRTRIYTPPLNWTLIATNTTAVINGTVNSISYDFVNDGNYTWRLKATDNIGKINMTAAREFQITTNDVVPNVTMVSPTNTTYDVMTIDFNITVVDDERIDTCWYTLDSGVTNITMANDSISNYYNRNLTMTDGSHTVNFYCNDTYDNINNTESETFFVFTETINLIEPENAETLLDIYSNFTANYTIGGGAFVNITYYIWNSTGIFNKTNMSITGVENATTLFINDLAIQPYTWNTYVCAIVDSRTFCYFDDTNYTFTVGVEASNFTGGNWSYETDDQTFTVKVQLYPDTSLVLANFVYNNTLYPVSNISIDGDDYTLSREIDTPLTSNTYSNMTQEYYWSFTYVDGSDVSSQINTTIRKQNVTNIIVHICNATYPATTSHALNFTMYDELTTELINATLNPTTLKATFDYWIGSGSVYKTYSYENLTNYNGSSYQFCIFPNDEIIQTDMDMEYTAANYSTRKYFLSDAPLDNVSNDIRLELLNDDDSVKFFIQVREGMTGFPYATTTISKWFPGEGQYRVTEIRETDNDGRFVAYLDLDQIYNFLIVKNGVSYGTINAKALCTEAPCELTLQIEEAETDMWQGYYDVYASSISYTLDYNDSSQMVTYTFNDLTGLAQYFQLDVLQTNYNNPSELAYEPDGTYCNKTLAAVTGTLTCDLSNYTDGDFKATGYISRSPSKIVDYITFVISSIKDTLGSLGIFVSFLLIVVIGLVGCWNPAVGVVLTSFAVLMMKILGFVAFSYTTVILIIIMAIIVVFKMKS